MAKRDISKPTYYLDSCVLIDLIEYPEDREPAKTVASIISDAQKGRFNLVTSTISIVEVLFAIEERNNKKIDPKVESTIQRLWHPGSSPIQLVTFHELIAKEAVQLFRSKIGDGWAKVKGNDMAHLVTARREMVTEFFTNEEPMRRWEPIVGFKICRPHYEPEAPPKLEQTTIEQLLESKKNSPDTIAPPTVDHDPHWLIRMSKTRQLIARDTSRFGHRRPLGRK